jgi:4-amino-4-deoxy-L-arabinose transferase-like glycosyltransferase
VAMILADPLDPSGYADRPATGRPRSRWQVWRSPDGQPPWARPALLAIAALAAVLYAWNIQQAGLAPFYSVAVKSMSVSWKAFIFGAFDPKATITIDKLAGSFLPQALSARIFGYSAWSLALPQVIEGVISVLVMYRVVRRWAGVMPGLAAAGVFTLTPIAASMFGHSMEDGALTLCLILAADAYQRAVMEARLRSLIWAGVWVGIGFQTKMLEAWMVLPAFAVGYLVAAPTGLGRRLWQLGVAGVVMLAVSLSWIALYTFTPAADRPWVDGSTNNSAVAMVFGYNGLERFGISFPGAVTSGPGVTSGGDIGVLRFAGGGGAAGTGGGGSSFGTGWTKLLGSGYGPEIGWLYPLAVLALVCGLLWMRRAKRSDQVRAGFVMWGVWLLTVGLVFSKMSVIPHTAYLAALAAPLAALSAAGIVMFWRAYRAGGWRGWMLPFAIAVQLAWTLFLWKDYGGFLPWARDAIVVVGVIAIVVLVAARLSRRAPARLATARLATAGLATAVAAVLAAPGAWAASVLDTTYGGTSLNASAGPAGSMGGGGFGRLGGNGPVATPVEVGAPTADGVPVAGGSPAGGAAAGGATAADGAFGDGQFGGEPGEGGLGRYGDGRYGGRGDLGGAGRGGAGLGGGFGGGITGTATIALSASEQRIYDYVSAHRDGAGYLMAVGSWDTAAPYIVATGQEVMPMGGFSGTVPEPTLARVQELVRTGQLRFFLVAGGGAGGAGGVAGFGAGGRGDTATTIDSWAESACAAVPAADYEAAASATGPAGAAGLGATAAQTLYACSPGS